MIECIIMQNYEKETPRVPPIPSEQSQFTDHAVWFEAFLANTNQKLIQELEVLLTLQTEFPQMRERMVDPNYDFELLFVGGGTGVSETALACDVVMGRHSAAPFEERDPLHHLAVYYIDPSLEMHIRFTDTFRQHSIERAIKEQSMEKFECPSYIPHDADCSVGFQMWSYVNPDSWRGVPYSDNSLVKFAKTVQKKGGVAVLSLPSEEGDLYKVRGKQFLHIHGHEDLVAERITAELDVLGVQYLANTVRSVTNVSSFFQNGEFNPIKEGEDILSFMLRVSWETLTTAQKQVVAEDVQRLVQENKGDLLHEDREVLFFRDTYIYIPGDQAILAQ